MSSISTPTDMFQHLSLNSQMSSTSEEVKSRAAEIRDVLSSFDREILPAEYRPDTFDRLDRPVISRPQMQSEWTVQQDLVATLLQWGCYDDQAYTVITRIQPLQTRTRLFHEKLKRRFQDLFHHYDVLDGTVGSSQEAHDLVQDLADRFVALVNAVSEDRQYRELGQPRTAELVLDALIGVSSRNEDLMLSPEFASPASERSGATPAPPRSDTSLFQALIRDSKKSQGGCYLVLDLLDSYPPAVIGQHKVGLQQLSAHLDSSGAPKPFIDRTSRLLAIAEDYVLPEEPEEEPAESSAASGRPEAQMKPSTGSKRSATEQTPSKRGRKKTSK